MVAPLPMHIYEGFDIHIYICICMHPQAESDGSATMTDGQLQWVNTMKSMVSQKADKSARRPTSALRRAC